MNRRFKVVLSILFVALVAFFVAKAFWPKPSPAPEPVKVVQKKKPAAAVKKKPAVLPRVAIILDDWGMNRSLVDDAVAVGRPLTLAVLPNLAHSREIAERAHAAGLGVMLHMPMQPKGSRQPAEPHTILTTTGEAAIVRYLDEALASVPHAGGVNNHQGSAATGDPRVMRVVLSHLRSKGLFFVDSKVISSSVGGSMARETGIRFAQRDVFIDNVPELEAVKQQLRKAIDIARRRGRAVVIGHDKKATLEAIRQTVPEFDKAGVRLVLAREMVQ